VLPPVEGYGRQLRTLTLLKRTVWVLAHFGVKGRTAFRPLFAEYEVVLTRPETRRRCPLTAAEQMRLFDAFLSRTRLVEVYYRWRPNLPDEGDNHVLELAVAAGDAPIVTFNRRDFRGGELRFPSIVVQTPAAWLNSQSDS
jgi:predicted nucleic acid-binding protein